MYYLIIGEFIYTQEEYQTWVLGAAKTETNYFDKLMSGIYNWIANPFNLLGLGVFGIVIIMAIAALVLFWFFGRPKGRLRRG